MRMLAPLLLALQVAAAAGCADPVAPAGSDGPPAPREAVPSISDGVHGGEDGFYFLPPLVPEPSFDGTFDPGRLPTVEVCRLGDTACGEVVATFTRETGPGSETVRVDTVAEQYVVNFHTDDFELVDGAVYRIRVLLEGIEAGHADVVPVSSGKEMKSADTDETIALLDGRTLPIKFRIEEELSLDLTVPAVAPSSVPDSIYDAENRISNSPLMSGTFLRNIVLVVFRDGATRAKRQEAIDLVDGEVVGGKRVFDDAGYYFVRISDDGTAGPLFEVIELLESLPQVSLASPEILSSGFDLYRRPTDGSGFAEGDWSLATSDASGSNWGLERIASPLAWGCNVGDTATTVAVVDRGFHGLSDLQANLSGSLGLGAFPTGVSHGTSVAAVLAASGNDSTQITGTMWRAGLELLDYGVDAAGNITRDPQGQPEARLSELMDRVERAAASGAALVNMSVGADTASFVNPGPNAPQSDSVTARTLAANFSKVVESTAADGFHPLFVLAAGNGGKGSLRGVGIDAFWAGFPIARDRFPGRILVVAASEQDGESDRLAGFSNDGPLIEIAAPGTEIHTLESSGGGVSLRGTSFAAPFVSGTAGLLASFDPRLDAAALKSRILEGAAAGGRTAGGIPVLNAHESLKAVAEEPDAPLCGNRVWAADGSLHADRAGTAQPLAPVVGSPIAQVEGLHGGKFVRYLTIVDGQRTHRAVRWPGGSGEWAETSAAIAEPRGGTLLSVFGLSHDQDTVAVIDASDVSGTRWYETADTNEAPVFVQVPDAGSSERVGRIPVRDFEEPVELTCIQRDADTEGCVGLVAESRFWFFRLGYPQFPSPELGGRQATVTVSPMHYVRVDSTAWTTCSFDASLECRDVQFRQLQAGALAYRMDLASSSAEPVRLDSIGDQSIFWAGQGEQGDDLALGRGEWRITLWAGGERFEAAGNPFFDLQGELLECVIEYRERVDFGALGSPVSSQDACFFTSFDRAATGSGGGTIAPDVTVSGAGPASAEGTPVALPMVRPTPAGLEADRP